MLGKCMVICPGGKSFKCLVCKRKFQELSELKAHVLDHDEKRKNCKCTICTEDNTSSNNGMAHSDKLSSSNIPVSISSTIATIPTSIGHITVSTDMPVFSAEEETTVKKANDDHIEINKILQTDDFVDCNEINLFDDKLGNYDKVEHGPSMPLFPEELISNKKEPNMKSDIVSSLSSHDLKPLQNSKDNISTNEFIKKSFSELLCIVCGKNFNSLLELRYHHSKDHPIKQHLERDELTNDTPFGCELCGKAFASVISLEEHVFKHTTGFDNAEQFDSNAISQPEQQVSDINHLNAKEANKNERQIPDINTLWNDNEIVPSPRIPTWRYGEDKKKPGSTPQKKLYQDYSIISSKHVCVYCAKVFDRYSYMIRHIRSNKYCREKHAKKNCLENVSKTSLNSTVLHSRNIPVPNKTIKVQCLSSLDNDEQTNAADDKKENFISQNNYNELQTFSVGYDNEKITNISPKYQQTISESYLGNNFDDGDGFCAGEQNNDNESWMKKVENKFNSSIDKNIRSKLDIGEDDAKSDLSSLKDNSMDESDQEFSDEDNFERYTDPTMTNAKVKQDSRNEILECEVCGSECKLNPDLNIKICQKRYTINKGLCTRILIHEAEKPFRCLVCNDDFIAICSLKDHMLNHEEELTCKLCLKTFLHVEQLKAHMDLMHKYPKRKYIRKDLFSSFDKVKDLNNENISSESDPKYLDKICTTPVNTTMENILGENTESSSNHITSHDTNPSDITKSFIANVITDVSSQPSKTSLCEDSENKLVIISQTDTADDLTSLIENINCHHDDEYDNNNNNIDVAITPVSGIDNDNSGSNSFVTEDSKVTTHESSKTIELVTQGNSAHDSGECTQGCCQVGVPIVKCPNCQSECNWSSDLEIFICDKKFNLTKELRKQILIKPESQNPYECRICEKDFTYLCMLKDHMGSHSDELEKQYTCDCCGEYFELKSLLKAHMLQFHQDDIVPEPPGTMKKVKELSLYYSCEICSGAFVTKTHLNHHKKQMHTVMKRIRKTQSWSEAEIIDCYNPAFLDQLTQEQDYEEHKVHCSTCDLVIVGNMPLVNHVKLFHTIPSDQPFSCDICSVKFKFKESLENHREVHYLPNMDGVKLFCRDCEMTFKPEYHFMKHMMGHRDKHPFECQICEKRFRLEAYLVVHQKKCGGREFPCKFCELVFKRESTLNNHMRFHTGEKKYVCDICGKAFMKHDSLWVHKKIHSTERFQCDLCGKIFKKEKGLKLHKMEHEGVIRFRCNICEYGTNVKGSFETHMQLHKDGRKTMHECKICNKKFMFKSELTVHTYAHTGETGPTCNVCGKVFADKQSLKYHYIRHFEENKIIECPKCDARFFKKKDRNIHLRKHEKEEAEKERTDQLHNEGYDPFHFSLSQNLNFMCGYCGENLNSNKALEHHVLSYHKDKTTLQIALQKTPQKSRNLSWDDGLDIPISFIDTSTVYEKDVVLNTIDSSIISVPESYAKEEIVSLLDPMTTPSKVVRNSPMKSNTSDKTEIKRDNSASSHTPTLNKDPLSDIVRKNPITPSYNNKWSKNKIGCTMKKENLEIEKLFSCETCGEGFGSLKKLKIHMLTYNQGCRTPDNKSLSTPTWQTQTPPLNKNKDMVQIAVEQFPYPPVWDSHTLPYNESIPHTAVVTFQSSSENVVSLAGDETPAVGKEIVTHNGGGNFPWETPKKDQVVVVVNRETPLAGETITHVHTNAWETPKEDFAVVIINKAEGDGGERSVTESFDNTMINVVLHDDEFISNSKTINDNAEIVTSYNLDPTTFTVKTTTDVLPNLATTFPALSNDQLITSRDSISVTNVSVITDKTTPYPTFPATSSMISSSSDTSMSLVTSTNAEIDPYLISTGVSPLNLDETKQFENYDVEKRNVELDDKENKDAGDDSDEPFKSLKNKPKKKYQCQYCNKIYVNKQAYTKHVRIHTGEKPYKCQVCCKAFITNYRLKVHSYQHTGGKPKDYICPLCGIGFSNRASLKHHYLKHTGERPYICTYCDKGFISKSSRDYHEKSHSGEIYGHCKVCHKGFRTKGSLVKHMLIHTQEQPLFPCSLCPKKFTGKRSLQNHILIHTGEKPFSCTVCNRNFRVKSSLAKHHCQKENNNFPCNICGKKFAIESALLKHIMIHAENRSFECDECGSKFRQKSSLASHKRLHTGENLKTCSECGKQFATYSQLKYHMKSHSDIKPFPCDKCKLQFRTQSHLKKHYVIHSDSKPFSCNACFKEFKREDNLKQHMLTHSGQKPYVCEFCQKSYTQKSALMAHLRIHSKELPYWCYICKQRFRTQSFLTAHMTNHSKGKQMAVHAIDIAFFCPTCGSEFSNPSELQDHTKLHEEEQKFQCTHCHQTFNRESDLESHFQTSCQSSHYICEICGQLFEDNINCTEHMQTHSVQAVGETVVVVTNINRNSLNLF